MRLIIAGVGRLKDGGERVLVDRYVARLALGRTIGIGPLAETEVAESRRASAAERLADEAARLAATTAQASFVTALAVDGRSLTSEAFAGWLAARRDAGTRHLAFVIGGPDGLAPDLVAGAGLRLSLGPMTLPHGLARAVLAEQLYRAVTILSGHPYHRA